jgi:hypothetical protein
MRSFMTCTLAKYNYNDQVKEDERDRACNMNEAKGNALMILVGKPEGKTPLGRPKCRRVDNIKMDFREMLWGGMHWRRAKLHEASSVSCKRCSLWIRSGAI